VRDLASISIGPPAGWRDSSWRLRGVRAERRCARAEMRRRLVRREIFLYSRLSDVDSETRGVSHASLGAYVTHVPCGLQCSFE
jgi:hypothetical protein